MDALSALRTVQARFAGSDPELPNGFAEHAPMGADALLALGVAPDAVVTWAGRHDPMPLDPAGVVATRRRDVLAALERQGWEDVVATELERLAPHVGAHLFHGVIRTAHAVRGLRLGVDDVALGELATALAAWHAWAGAPDAADPVAATADDLHRLLDAARRGAGACATSPSIFTIHATTAPMAFLLLAELADASSIAAAAEAFTRTHTRHPAPAPAPSPLATQPPADRLAALAEHWDAHPAKLTEAAMRGFEATGEGVFLAAVEAIMGPWPTTTPTGSHPTSSPPGSG
jgi:hypothetical protein